MPIPLIPAIIVASALASLAGQGLSAKSSSDQAKKAEEFQKTTIAKQEKDARKAALMRAIGADNIFRPSDIPQSPIFRPSMLGSTLGALGQFGGQLGAMKLGQQAYPTQAPSAPILAPISTPASLPIA